MGDEDDGLTGLQHRLDLTSGKPVRNLRRNSPGLVEPSDLHRRHV
jgi:hypothetical protein